MRVIAKCQHYQKIINHSNLDQSRNPYIDTTEITNLSNLESKTNRRYIFLKYHVRVYKLIACMKFHLSLRKPSWLATWWWQRWPFLLFSPSPMVSSCYFHAFRFVEKGTFIIKFYYRSLFDRTIKFCAKRHQNYIYYDIFHKNWNSYLKQQYYNILLWDISNVSFYFATELT